MPWLNNIISAITGTNSAVLESAKAKVQSANPTDPATNAELDAYIDDINRRIKRMVKDLKGIYSKNGVDFTGFKSLDMACKYLHESLQDGKEVAYNNLIKLESSITAEQKRHLSLIKIAMTTQGKKVIDQINQDPSSKEIFASVFGTRDVAGKENMDGMYQQLWSEIHKLSEYILMQKNKVYH